MTVEQIAKLCHATNRIVCKFGKTDVPVIWDESTQEQKDTIIKGVKFHLDNKGVTPEESHNSWMREKIANGWVLGELKDETLKTHPALKPYEELPEEQKIKDEFFSTIVFTCANF